MSRFFAASSSGSGSSSSGSDSDSPSLTQQPDPTRQKQTRNHYSSESDDDVKTAVVSQQEKLLGEVCAASKDVVDGVGSKDWVGCLEAFEVLKGKKYASVLSGSVPNVYIKAFALLEDGIKNALNDKVAVKNLNATVAKALNALNQKIRKHNVTLSDQLLAFRENPQSFEDAQLEPTSDSDDSVFGKDSSDESSSEDERQGLTGRNRWLKKVKVEKTNEELFAKNPKQRTQKVQSKEEKSVAFDDAKTLFVDITVETLYKKLQGVLEARGKRGTDRLMQIQILRQLCLVAQTPYQKIRVLLTLIPAQFDFSTTAPFMQGQMWKDVLGDIEMLLTTVESYPQIIITEHAEPQEDDAENEKTLRSGTNLVLLGNIASYIDRLCREFTKALQAIEMSAPEYLARLSQEQRLYELICQAQVYFSADGTKCEEDEAFMQMLRLAHLYAKPLKLIKIMEMKVKGTVVASATMLGSGESVVDMLATALYTAENERFRNKTILMHTTHHCIVSPFAKARHMIQSSGIQDLIFTTDDVSLQLLYNRMLTHLALKAFSEGLLKDAAGLLHELHYVGKVKELLGQETARFLQFNGKTLDQEKMDKQRQFPAHMHINLEMVECVYLVGCMVMEVPVLVSYAWDGRRKFVSKPFRRFLEMMERSVYCDGKKGVKDAVFAGVRAMIGGDWRAACECVCGLKVWDGMSGDVKTMLERRIKEECVSTYLVISAKNHTDTSLKTIAELFDLTEEVVEQKSKDVNDRGLIGCIVSNGVAVFEVPKWKVAWVGAQGKIDKDGECGIVVEGEIDGEVEEEDKEEGGDEFEDDEEVEVNY